jgi:hypothetical protein
MEIADESRIGLIKCRQFTAASKKGVWHVLEDLLVHVPSFIDNGYKTDVVLY